MGWLDVLNTALNVTSVAVDVANYTQLQQLRQQGASQAAVQAILKALRDEIFQVKQATQAVLENPDLSNKQAAAAMKMLEERLDESPITPEIFPDLNDKEYVAATIRLVHNESRRLMGQLTGDEQGEVMKVLQARRQLEDSEYYLQNREDGYRLLEAQSDVKELGWRHQLPARFGVGFAAGAILMVVGMIASAIFKAAGLWIAVIAGIGLIVWMVKWFDASRFRSAKNTVEKLGDKIDLERFTRFDDLVDGDVKHARALRDLARKIMDDFMKGERVSDHPLTPPARKQPQQAALPSTARPIDGYPTDTGGNTWKAEPAGMPVTGQVHEFSPGNAAEFYAVSADPGPTYLPQPEPSPVEINDHLTPVQREPFCGMCGERLPARFAGNFCPYCGESLDD